MSCQVAIRESLENGACTFVHKLRFAPHRINELLALQRLVKDVYTKKSRTACEIHDNNIGTPEPFGVAVRMQTSADCVVNIGQHRDITTCPLIAPMFDVKQI